jgi:hypothetical protein
MRGTAAAVRALVPIAVAVAADADPSPLAWPTDAGRCVTSSFCEFRPDHFHSGIDVSTGGRTGFKIFAVSDGNVVRARVACAGYGRAVYLRLADGRTAVYAHLSRFEGELADRMWERQESQGTAYVDLDLGAGIPVKTGDVLGYTGQSGVGVPHLHFEIRDQDERALDPLTEGFAVDDGTAPSIARVAFTPLSYLSSVDGRSDTVILDVHRDAEGGGRIPRTIPVEGEVGIAVEVDETADACRFRLAPRRIVLSEGDDVLFEVDYAGFAFSESGAIDLQIDPRFSYAKVGRFHNLWRRPGNDLPFYPAASSDGTIAAPRDADGADAEAERVRSLTIAVEDAAGNRGAADVRLSFAAPPAISVMSVRMVRAESAVREVDAELDDAWPDSVEVHGAYRPGGRPIRHIALEWSLDAGRTWHLADPTTPDPDHSFHARFRATRRVPGSGERDVLVRARAVDALGASGIARTMAPDTSVPPEEPVGPEPEIVTLGPWFEVRLPERQGFSAISGGWDEAGAVHARPWGRGVRLVLPDASPGPREWSGRGAEWKGYDPWGRPVPLRFEVPARVGPRDSAVVTAGGATIRFSPGAFAEPAWVRVRREAPPRPEGELLPASEIVFLDTGQVPSTGGFEVEIAPNRAIADPARLAVFVQEPDDLRYIGNEAREGGGRAATARTPLGIGLFEDVTPPVLGEPRLEERDGRVQLAFLAKDEGCGIDCDAVEVRFEGRSLVHELDDETGDVVAYPRLLAEPGAGGTFEMVAVDRCGNSSRRVEAVRLP